MKIGILGGTFNPPHIGHLVLAQSIKEQAGLDSVFFIPTHVPPHKHISLAKPHHRLAMIRAAVRNNTSFKVLDWELRRPGPSYTIDTLRMLHEGFPHDSFYLIIGSELANEFHTWRCAGKIRTMVKILVALRDEHPFIRRQKGFKGVDIIQVAVSSSLIRRWIQQGRSIQHLVPEAVYRYIKKYRLYRK